MLNLIRMDFYRLFKSFSLWITLAVTTIIAIVIGLFYNLIELSGNETFAIDEIIMEIFSGTDILIICTIFISLFVYADFRRSETWTTLSMSLTRAIRSQKLSVGIGRKVAVCLFTE